MASRTKKGEAGNEGIRRGKEHWFAAMRWRRTVEGELKSVGLTFTQWLVLEATQDVSDEADGAVNQSAVARYLELDRMTVSQVMRTLERQRMVHREPAARPPAFRLVVTETGKKALSKARTRLRTLKSAS